MKRSTLTILLAIFLKREIYMEFIFETFIITIKNIL